MLCTMQNENSNESFESSVECVLCTVCLSAAASSSISDN